MQHLLPLLLDTAIRITIYNHADVPPALLHTTTDHLRQIFTSSGIATNIVQGNPEAPEGFLLSFPGPDPDPCLARRDIAVRITFAAPSQRSSILGMSHPLAEKGLNVVVYYDRIRGTAAQRARPEGNLLAYALAHEIGHVLLRSGAHAKTGIMSANWGDVEFHWMDRGALIFSRGESRTMHAVLTGASCPALPQPPIAAAPDPKSRPIAFSR